MYNRKQNKTKQNETQFKRKSRALIFIKIASRKPKKRKKNQNKNVSNCSRSGLWNKQKIWEKKYRNKKRSLNIEHTHTSSQYRIQKHLWCRKEYIEPWANRQKMVKKIKMEKRMKINNVQNKNVIAHTCLWANEEE